MARPDDSFSEFVRARTHSLLRSAFLLTGDQHLAEDLVQEALARTHRAWGRLEREGNAEAYARKVMYHAQVSFWRRPKVAEVFPGDLPDRSGSTGDQAEVTAQRLVLRRALLTLSPKQRAVIILRYFEDHTEVEAADLMGVSVNTVKTQCARGLAKLRTLVADLRILEPQR
ncbi:SigE family RNA polymerase sigma factor [Actinoplanes palleronii]|uniref:DNA-directed RNA polymerase sigma-70 factor n=1 Tax=Actinoplanes palleronii TaxID=113570 RepID=A0ABQ4B765_9ACTN|nr:SigE family RNA polymerase sigma factor [Actinoplanes palleronii]GIE66500.1 DNA-directed RNA polymerase sigma-70 factor [Actinoplanes palleronii]